MQLAVFLERVERSLRGCSHQHSTRAACGGGFLETCTGVSSGMGACHVLFSLDIMAALWRHAS